MNLGNMRVVRTVEVKAVASGVDETTSSLGRLSAAQDSVASSAERMATTTERSTRGQTSVAGSFDRLRQRIDETYGATVRFERAQATLDRAHAQGLTSIVEHSRMLDLARTRYLGAGAANDNLTRSMGLARHEMINLGRQLQDVGTMAAMGASGMQILASQGAQVVDIFASSERGLGGWARAIGPVGAVVAVVTAVFGTATAAALSYSNSQDEVARSLQGVGRLSGATVGGINAAAEASAGAARVSIANAREMGSTFAATGRIGQELYGDLTITAARYAKTTGTDVADATKLLASAFADPTRGAMDLNRAIGGLSGRTLELIERQSAAGDRIGAQKTLQEALRGSLVGVTASTTAWGDAWDYVSRKAKDAYDATGRAMQRSFAPTLAEQINDTRSAMNAPARRGLSPYQIAAREKRLGLPNNPMQDQLEELLERQMWDSINRTLGTRQAEIADKTSRAKGIVGQLTPTNADILQLTSWKTALEEALATGQASSGTTEALARVNKLLAQGGTEASQLRDAARDLFNTAGLLPYAKGLADIENRYKRLIDAATDPRVIKGHQDAKADELAAYRIGNTDVVQRDYRMRIDEVVRGLQFQRESFGQAPDVVETMRAKMDMLTDAMRTGQSVTDRYGAGWEALAGQMGKAKAATDELQRSQQNIIGGMDEIRSGSRGLLTGIFSDARQGKNPLDNLTAAAGGMTDRLLSPANDDAAESDKEAA